MRGMGKPILIGGILLALSACTTALPPEKTTALGGPFNEHLKEGYLKLAYAGGPNSADYYHFRHKASATLVGDTVYPDRVGDSRVLAADRPEALELRERLINALEDGGRQEAPADAARAQVNFDCWLDEAGASPLSAGASDCKQAFLVALDQVEARVIGPPAAAPPYVVLFERGSVEPTAEGRKVIDEAADAAARAEAGRIDVVGYADSSGAAAYNQELSQRRAQAVADALVEAGAPSSAVRVAARGETELSPMDAENRRVEISLVP